MTDGFDRFIWVDIETTGLDPATGLLLEVGFRITDVELNLIDHNEWQIWEDSYDGIVGIDPWCHKLDEFIRNMHFKSGLLDLDGPGGEPLDKVAEQAYDWLITHNVGKTDPMCGSSVQFDRGWLLVHMPYVESLFSYRNIDISTIKELCRRLNPDLYSKLEKYSSKREMHRVMPDLEDTCSEANFYFQNFLHLGDPA